MRGVVFGLVLVLIVAAPKPVFSVHVSPAVLFEGTAVRVQCRVPLDADNRRLRIALEGYRSSELPIHGDQGPVTTEVTYDHVPCEVEIASCTILAVTGAMRRTVTAVTVICRG